MVPKYMYRVEARYKTSANLLQLEVKNFEILAAAWEYRGRCLTRPNCYSVTVLGILDETARVRFQEPGIVS